MNYQELTLEGLREHRADLVEAIASAQSGDATEAIEAAAAAALAEGRRAGAEDERTRILSIEEAAAGCTGIEKLVAEMKVDGTTTGEQASAKILAAVKQQGAGVLADLAGDDPKGLNAAPSGGNEDEPDAKTLAAEITRHKGEQEKLGRTLSYAQAAAEVRAA